jgi:hypothetical protein
MADFADTVPVELARCPLSARRSPLASLPRAADEELERVAASIDARVIELESAGFKDVAMLSLMVDHASGFQRLMRDVQSDRRRELLQRYAGLVRFGSLLARAKARI